MASILAPASRPISNSQPDSVREIHVHDGMLVTRSAIIQKKTYTIHNVDPRAKTLIIEYPDPPGYKLIDTAPPWKPPATSTASK